MEDIVHEGFIRLLALVMPRLGFVMSSIILLAVLSTFYGNRNLLAGAAISIGS